MKMRLLGIITLVALFTLSLNIDFLQSDNDIDVTVIIEHISETNCYAEESVNDSLEHCTQFTTIPPSKSLDIRSNKNLFMYDFKMKIFRPPSLV